MTMHSAMAKKPATAETEGPRFGRLGALGVMSPAHAPLLLPRSYRDFTKTEKSLRALINGGEAVLRLRITERRQFDENGNQTELFGNTKISRVAFNFRDESGEQGRMTIFGMTRDWKDVQPDSVVTVFARAKLWKGYLQADAVELVPEEHLGRAVPVYRQKKRVITSETVSRFIWHRLRPESVGETIEIICREIGLPEQAVLARASVPFASLAELLRAIHWPSSMDQAKAAIEAAKALTALFVVERGRHVRQRPPEPKSAVAITRESLNRLAAKLPFSLTKSQRVEIAAISRDLASPYAMRRLLTADVGYGKTAAFMIPALAAAEAGATVAVITPNQLLVDQVIDETRASFPEVTLHRMVSGHKIKKVERGEIVIGTSAIHHWAKKTGFIPDFLVVDEQHKQSREMRESLCAPWTNQLEATATPIPRSLALVSHLGMDVSCLVDSPVQKEIATKIVPYSQKGKMPPFIEKIIAKGGQAAIIYANVSGEDEVVCNLEEASEWWEKRFPGKVVVMHGRLKDDEKAAVISDMKENRFQLLLASIIIEAGLTLPSLKAVAVANADRFGLAALHQLRGRVARTGGRGYCFFVESANCGEDGRERLQILERTNNGFEVAEADMRRRGFGDLSEDADAQSGICSGIFMGMQITPELVANNVK